MRVPLIYKDAPQFGFDLGTHSVKVVQLHRAGHKTKVQGYGEGYFSPDAMAEGIVVDPVEIATAIRPLLRKLTYGKITARRVVAGIPATKLFTRVLQLPQMDTADLTQAIHYEVEQYVPVPVNDLYIDYEIITPAKDADSQMNVLMTAAPRAIVDSYIKLFDTLGFEVAAIEADMAAVVRALVQAGDASEASLIMNVGSVSADLAVYDHETPLSGSVPVGGDQQIDALMQALGIKLDQATEIKAKFGLGPSGMRPKIAAALEPSMQTMIREVKNVMKFYQGGGNKKAITKLVLTGGAARMPGFDEYIHTALNLPLAVANPWNNLTLPHPPSGFQKEGLTYSTAIGLALRGLQ